ncbi:TPA: DNA-binding protein [Yersinia enterocolitica]|nr:DNA-binding protein [Yersinia enterocolitica]HEN3640951.1 DNA-binding protein [Yersinia enterocolitica]
MKKEWFSASELLSHPLLPTTTQGIHKKAKRENWIARKRIGIQGKGIEYFIYSFPDNVSTYIYHHSELFERISIQEYFDIWINAFKQLTPSERHKLSEYIDSSKPWISAEDADG